MTLSFLAILTIKATDYSVYSSMQACLHRLFAPISTPIGLTIPVIALYILASTRLSHADFWGPPIAENRSTLKWGVRWGV
jgi:hypothetical protein